MAGDNDLQRMIREKRGGEAVGGGEEAVLRGDAGEGFERFLGEGAVAIVADEGVHANQGDGGNGIGAGRGRILKGLAADVEAAHGGGVGRAVEEAAAFSVAVAGDREVHGFLCSVKIAGIERGLIGVEERENAEDLIVERAFESGAADAMAETAGFAPDFFQHVVECFQGEGAAVVRNPRNILGWIMMHFAAWFDIVVELYYSRFFRRENSANFVERPSEIITVIV